MIFRILKAATLAILILGLLLLSRDTLHLGRTESAASSYLYGLVEWEVGNFFSKWVHKVATAFPWASDTAEEKRAKVDRYFQLGEQIRELQHKVERAAAQTGHGSSQETTDLESELARLVDEQDALRNDVEEFLESELSAVLNEQGLSSRLGAVFPPTDFRFDQPPRLLVTSPRDRIERKDDVLLRPDLTIEQMESLEERIESEQDLSTLVVGTGGIATYPAIIPATQPLRETLEVASHEWLHHFFFFRPLGQHFWDNQEMASLNETVADIAGKELGSLVCVRLLGEVEECAIPESEREGVGEDEDGVFSFNREMRETRLRVEELLSEGKVVEAEAYMEERRQLFVENRYLIRKLNQAYFAFHGTYADRPASISPIGSQLEELRALLPSVGEFIKTVSRISTYERFLALLDEMRAKAGG